MKFLFYFFLSSDKNLPAYFIFYFFLSDEPQNPLLESVNHRILCVCPYPILLHAVFSTETSAPRVCFCCRFTDQVTRECTLALQTKWGSICIHGLQSIIRPRSWQNTYVEHFCQNQGSSNISYGVLNPYNVRISSRTITLNSYTCKSKSIIYLFNNFYCFQHIRFQHVRVKR